MMHFNLWIEHDPKNNMPFLDIGLMIEELNNVSNIFIYFPFSTKKEHLSDLGCILSSDANILNAIFNENYSLKKASASKQTSVYDNSDKEIFSIYNIDFGS